MFETMSTSKYIHVIANEKLKTNLKGVWNDLSKDIKSFLHYDIPLHSKQDELSQARINKNKQNREEILP